MTGFKDPYVYEQPDKSGLPVLKNKFGIKDFHSLRELEYELATFRELEWRQSPKSNTFDFNHLKAIHKHVFSDMYEWAGEQRSVELSKGRSVFIPSSMISTFADATSYELKQDNFLRGLKKPEFVDKLAKQYQRWNEVHPFREGNGRSTRIFLSDISEKAGYVFLNSVIERNKDLWNRAAIRAMPSNENDIGELKALFNQVAVDSRAYYLAKTNPEIALRKHPELMLVYQDVNEKTESLKNNPEAFKRGVQAELKRHIYEITNNKSSLITALPGATSAMELNATRERKFDASNIKKSRGVER